MPPTPRPIIAPLSPGRFELHLTMDEETHEQMRYAQALLGHAVPSGDVVALHKRAMDALVRELERQKFAKCARTRPRHGAPEGRYVPADIRRTVWQRDGGRCTFESGTGKRCPACSRIEFDHIEPVARGGATTAANLRLRCRAHNQYAAECALGAGFMQRKRKEAKARAMRKHAKVAARASAGIAAPPKPTPEQIEARARGEEAIPWLRRFRSDEAPRGPALCEAASPD